jgi:hypothetical protein
MTTTRTIVIAVFATIMWMTMVLPISANAQTTEDDGYFTPGDSVPEEQAEQEQEEWEEAGRPGERDENNDANPYCDLVPDDYRGTCHDRYDYDEELERTTGKILYPCNDGTQEKDPLNCKDASNFNYNNN